MSLVDFWLTAAHVLTMCPKKGRRERKIEVPTDSVPEFKPRGQSGRYPAEEGEEAQQHLQSEEEARREEARVEESHWQKERHPKKPPGQKEVTLKQMQLEERKGPSRYKQGHMTNVYLTDSDEEAMCGLCEGIQGVVRKD